MFIFTNTNKAVSFVSFYINVIMTGRLVVLVLSAKWTTLLKADWSRLVQLPIQVVMLPLKTL